MADRSEPDPEGYGSLSRIDYREIEKDGPMPALTSESVRVEARKGLEEIRDFITTDVFIALLDDLYSLPVELRDGFVREVILSPEKLTERGVAVPAGIKLQRSQFGDGRPTIFCVTKLMSDGVRKVTYTFDSDGSPILS